jgi:uncharacterized protein (DUF433 family)
MSARRPAANNDPRNQAAYPLSEAAKYLKLPAATLRAWAVGRPYPKAHGLGQFRALLSPPQKRPPVLSFWNLIEAHVLRSLRTEHGIPIREVRLAIEYAERKHGIDRLLLSPELCSAAGRLFIDRYGELIALQPAGQLALRQVFEAYLKRVQWDDAKFPVRLHPFLSHEVPVDRMSIAIDANISFGRPVVLRVGVSTATIVSRIDAGEAPDAVAEDYGLTVEEIQQAVIYEKAA